MYRTGLLLLALVWTVSAAADPKHVYLTYSDAPETTIDINIVTDRKTDKVHVYYDTVSRGGNTETYTYTVEAVYIPSTIELADRRALYVARLTGLTPGTMYYFMTGDDTYGYTYERKFRSLPGGDAPIRFVNGGDMGMDGRAVTIQRVAASHNPDFALLGGDLAYADGMIGNHALWDSWFENWDTYMRRPDGAMIPIITCIGNHEVNKTAFAKPALRAPWYLPLFGRQGKELYFSRKVGNNMVFLILDTGYINTFDGPQAQWLESTLQAHADVPHKFAVYHMPLYPAFSNYDGPRQTLARETWGPLFDQYGVRVAFEHDDHVAKRSHPIQGDAVAETGTIYVGDGAFGRESRDVDRELRWYNAMEVSTVHFWLVDVTREKVTLQAIDRKGVVFDAVTLP
jgi:hypothetical protein